MKVAQSFLTLCNPVNYSPPGFSTHGILQERTLEWVAILFSRGLSRPGIKPGSLTLQADSLPSEPPGKPNKGSSWEWKQLWLKIGNQSGVGPHHSWTAWPSANLWSLWSPQGYLCIFQRLQIRHLILEVLHSKRKPFSSNSLITVSKPSMWLLAGYQCICDWEGFQDMGLSELKWESEVKWKSLSCVQSVLTPWTIQSMEFSRQEYWSG